MDNLRKAFGDEVRERREDASMTQAMLALAADMSRPTVVNIELARQGVSLEQMYVLSRVLEVPPCELLQAVEARRSKLNTPLAGLTENDRSKVDRLLQGTTSR